MLLTCAQSASAHAMMMSSTPRAGAVLQTLPRQVSFMFSETVQLPSAAVRILNPDGKRVDTGSTTENGKSVTVGLRADSMKGSYTVAWQVISADSHPVSGAITFAVGHPSAMAAKVAAAAHEMQPSGSETVGILYGIVRGIAFAGLALLVGSVAFVLMCWPAGVARRSVRLLSTGAWATLVFTAVATFLLEGPYGARKGLLHLFDPSLLAATAHLHLGIALMVRLALLAAAAGFLRYALPAWVNASVRPRIVLAGSGAALSLALAATWSVAGHADTGMQTMLAMPLDVLHLTAMSIWLGGLATLLIALRRESEQRAVMTTAVKRFSPLAFSCVLMLVGSGSYQVWRQLGTWPSFVDTAYGRLLVVKLSCFVTVIAIAGVSRRAVQRWHQPDGSPPPAGLLRRSVLTEASGAIVLIAVTAVLVNANPSREAHAEAAAMREQRAEMAADQGPVHKTVRFDTGGSNGSGRLELMVTPAGTGPNTVSVIVTNSHGNRMNLPELDLALVLPARNLGPMPVTVQRTSLGAYHATSTEIPLAGKWQLHITVRTSDIDETTLATSLSVG